MDKSLFKDFIIAQATFEFHYAPVSDIHRLVSDFESNLMTIFQSKATETMVPVNSPPNVPRFILSSKNRVLEVGPVSAVYKSNPENLNGSDAIKLYEDKTRKIFQYLDSKKDKIKLESLNTSNLIQFPLKDTNYPLEQDIFNKFFKIKKPVDFHGASLTIVRNTGNYFFTNTIDVYEKRDINIVVTGQIDQNEYKFKRFPITDFRIIERGLINNIIIKQKANNGNGKHLQAVQLFDEILKLTKDKIKNHADLFIFKGQNE